MNHAYYLDMIYLGSAPQDASHHQDCYTMCVVFSNGSAAGPFLSIQAQLCPGCGVPTQRSEGCRKITCVCGRVGGTQRGDSGIQNTPSWEEFCWSDFFLGGSCGLVLNTKIQIKHIKTKSRYKRYICMYI